MKFVAALILAIGILHVQECVSQIPRACTDPSSLSNMICCPATADGLCGINANRGECVSLQLPAQYSTETTDVRNNWPHYFTQACRCSGNYAGYDCSRCKFGYYGADCSQKQVLPRPSVANFSDEDWSRYNEIISMTRTYDSGYVAVLEETIPGNTSLRTANMTLYGMFVWMHHYAAKDSTTSQAPVPPDYAHTAPGFYTWHRMLGVWLEWEIQGMLESISDPNYHMFRLPYWDWRRELQLSTGLSADDLFTVNRLGATMNDSGRARVYGDLYGNGWETMCWRRLGQICDPRENTGLLQRCPFTGTNPCSSSNPDWPSSMDVLDVLGIDDYDAPPYNRLSAAGFRTTVDFINGRLTPEECSNDRQCRCLPSLDANCANGPELTSKSGMHFLGHIIIGQGDLNFFTNNDIETIGTFEDVAASPNDPAFILHHNMIDCILIEWLRRHPGTEYPRGVLTPGHARDGFLVPFFPLFTNNELFVDPEELGYTCSLSGLPPIGSSMTISVSMAVMLVACLFAAVFNFY